MVIHLIPYDASYASLPTTTVPIASRAPTIDKTNGSLLLTFARGTRGEIDCFVMSESLFTIDWFLDGWPIRDQLFETEYQVLVQYNCVSVHDTTCYCMCLLYSFSVRVRMFPPPKTPPHSWPLLWHVQLLNDGQTLVLPNADIRHAGNYMCLVTNDVGIARLQAIVEVTRKSVHPPRISCTCVSAKQRSPLSSMNSVFSVVYSICLYVCGVCACVGAWMCVCICVCILRCKAQCTKSLCEVRIECMLFMPACCPLQSCHSSEPSHLILVFLPPKLPSSSAPGVEALSQQSSGFTSATRLELNGNCRRVETFSSQTRDSSYCTPEAVMKASTTARWYLRWERWRAGKASSLSTVSARITV